MMTSKLIER